MRKLILVLRCQVIISTKVLPIQAKTERLYFVATSNRLHRSRLLTDLKSIDGSTEPANPNPVHGFLEDKVLGVGGQRWENVL